MLWNTHTVNPGRDFMAGTRKIYSESEVMSNQAGAALAVSQNIFSDSVHDLAHEHKGIC